ncbi:site-specific DNA-methyltransferase [Microbacterium algeriense]|uniref:site-specific DNA-methyltransferase n=1 Tax=Microbacterium algeriense TaxID=2615184 RepID=UPI0029AE4DFC|nr:site-specific DNA-methyltransferase [Microbacterium algeriense]MDX2398666.1 site-specific DNA-methyltransferase [Microbacterium algeriense]
MTLEILSLIEEQRATDSSLTPVPAFAPPDPSHRSIPVDLLRGDTPDGIAVVGDAGRALAVLPRMRPAVVGNVKLCYIDPPYNTGERFAYYDDRRDSRAWLTDLKSHLEGLRPLLSSHGSVWVHLDDSEQHRARVVLDEVFGRDSFVGTIIWQKRLTRDNRKAFSSMHDYIHVYAPAGPKVWKRVRNGLVDEGVFANPDNDPRGPWRSAPMTVQAGHATTSQFYTVVTPTGVRHEPPAGRCWTYTEARLRQLVSDGRVYWPRNGDGKPRLKRYQSESGGLAPFTVWSAAEVGDTAGAKKALLRDFPLSTPFDTPKPIGLLERIIAIATDPGDLVLDYYLGSGTTAVAAQRLGRPWVGVERNAEVVERFVIPRLQNEYAANPTGGFGVSRLNQV